MEDMYTNSRIATHFVVKQSIKSDPIMHYAPLPLPKALAGLVAALGVSALSSFAQDIPANTAVSPPLNYPGGNLKGLDPGLPLDECLLQLARVIVQVPPFRIPLPGRLLEFMDFCDELLALSTPFLE